jgi:MYXO-CTERM domain-containing protein
MVVLNSAPNLLLDNNTDDDNYLVVRVYADLSSCEDAPQPVHREDIGAVAILASESGTALGAREVNGGQGHGSQGTSWLHWGLADGPTVAHELTVHFRHGDHESATLRVVPADLAARNADGYQLLEVLASDPDGDGISTLDEMMDAGDVHDLDGDGYPNWYDEDSDGDGISDADEAGDDDPCTPAFDRDDNGVLDYLEDGPVPDASVPDGAVPDGAAPDARVDAAPIDGGGMDAAALVAHGGGCAECTASGSRDGGAPAVMAWAVVLGLFALHRTRRRR